MADSGQKFFFLDMTSVGIIGTSNRPKCLNWLELDGWTFSMSQNADPNVGGGKPKGIAASGSFGFDIKYGGPGMLKHCAIGNHINTPLTFRAFRSGVSTVGVIGSQPNEPYFELVFTGVVVAGRSHNGDEDNDTEHIDFAFTQVKLSYWQVKDGQVQPVLAKTYNMKENSVV